MLKLAFRISPALLLVVLLVMVLASVSLAPALVVAQNPPPPYDPRPLCSDRTGATSPIVRYDIPFGTVTSGGVYCRVLVQNGQYLVNAAQIGSQTAINLGITQAVDVFAILTNGSTITTFNNSFKVCLIGTGGLFFLDANQSPRQLVQITGLDEGGYTCGTLSSAGTLVLASSVPASSNPAATAVPVTVGPGTPQPTGTVSAAGITATFPLGTCSVTISRTVRLREEPTTTSKILTRLAYNTTWQATERIPGWFRVVWQDTQGWVSSDYVRATGSCGR